MRLILEKIIFSEFLSGDSSFFEIKSIFDSQIFM